MATVIDYAFETVTVGDLETMPAATRDRLAFGVIGIDKSGIAQIYNATEARMAGLDPDTVLGTSFFDAIAQCMNNFMVAQRLDDEPDLDDVIPYTLTLRMRPTPVRLRLLAKREASLRFVLIER